MKPRLYIPDDHTYGPPFETQFELVYDHSNRYNRAMLGKCDYLLLTGGADIYPSYYGQEPYIAHSEWFDLTRDRKEYELACDAIEKDIPIIGVCRGAQWLSILNGGKLIQHVTNHEAGFHTMKTTDELFQEVSATTSHHQMCDLGGVAGAQMLAWTEHRSDVYLGNKGTDIFPKGLSHEPEVFYIPNKKHLGIQGHPEYVSRFSPYQYYLRHVIEDLYGLNNPLPLEV